MTEPNSLGWAVVGLGYMGRTHIRAWRALRAQGDPSRLIAVYDRNPERLSGRARPEGPDAHLAAQPLFDPDEVRAAANLDELLDNPHIACISICTHTDTHVDFATRALRAGKHVLVEKPVAFTSREIRALQCEATAAARLCMPALCMRFWPEWRWLKEQLSAGSFGEVRSAAFERLTSAPFWGQHFYTEARSGGALYDLHVHDVDFLSWCFGRPAKVRAYGSPSHVHTLYMVPGGPDPLSAAASWEQSAGFGFRMRYRIVCEQATLDFDLERHAPLVVFHDGRRETVSLPQSSAYEEQLRAFFTAIRGKAEHAPVPLQAALDATSILEAEARSLVTGMDESVASGST